MCSASEKAGGMGGAVTDDCGSWAALRDSADGVAVVVGVAEAVVADETAWM